jgi:hypothetical protein
MGPFQNVNVSQSHERSNQADMTLPMTSQPHSTGSIPVSSQTMGSAPTAYGAPSNDSIQNDFMGMNHASLGPAYQHTSYHSSSHIYESSDHQVPLLTLQVPDSTYTPSLNHYSPQYGSSESTWSTPSDVSRQGTNWPRDRSVSIPSTQPWDVQSLNPPAFVGNPLQNMRPSSLDIVPENFEPSYVNRHYSSPMVLYNQPIVGTTSAEEIRSEMVRFLSSL